MESNNVRDIKTKETLKMVAHRPPTQDQRLTIIGYIKKHYRPYFRFLAVLYGCGIRPKEITQIKIKHLHKLEGLFRLPGSGQLKELMPGIHYLANSAESIFS